MQSDKNKKKSRTKSKRRKNDPDGSFNSLKRGGFEDTFKSAKKQSMMQSIFEGDEDDDVTNQTP